ncbi:glycosyltransferase family 2 protein [Aeromonas veronii]
MIKNKPLISVVIPSYNHAEFIHIAIESVLRQSYKNLELIVIDDGSKDGSQDIIEALSKKYGFTCIFQQNKGLSETLNRSLSIAKGDFITFCSSDDYYHADKLKVQLEKLSEDKYASCVVSKAVVVDDHNNGLPTQTTLYNRGLSAAISFEDLLSFKIVLPVTCMYKLDTLKQVGGFDPLATAEDYDMSLKMALIGKILFVDEFLYFYRSPAAIGSTRKRRPMRLDVSESHLRTINKYHSHPAYNEAILEWNYRRFILFCKYRDTKLYALKGMFGSISKMKEKMYIKSLFKLALIWMK